MAERTNLSTVVGVGQIATMVVGFAGLIYAMGVKSASVDEARTDIDKLAATVNDLARAQASAAVADATHTKTLEEIQRRLGHLEERIR